jgi:3-methylfumaryl-CoA hydratase
VTAELCAADLGLVEETVCLVDAGHAARLAVAIGSPTRPRDGDVLPFLWHWGFFAPTVPTGDLGDDGHPRLPPSSRARRFPRRMWAGGSLRAAGPLVVGRPVVRRSGVSAVTEKTGRSGSLLIVELRHDYRQDGADALVETQTLVYRTAGGAIDPPLGEFVPRLAPGEWSERVCLGPVDVFRFSAVTFNSHRIHYDAPYARSVEGYPGLVVQGPLTALLLAASAQRATGRSVVAMRFRAAAPLFADLGFTIVGQPDGDRVAVTAIRGDATAAMTAELELRASS